MSVAILTWRIKNNKAESVKSWVQCVQWSIILSEMNLRPVWETGKPMKTGRLSHWTQASLAIADEQGAAKHRPDCHVKGCGQVNTVQFPVYLRSLFGSLIYLNTYRKTSDLVGSKFRPAVLQFKNSLSQQRRQGRQEKAKPASVDVTAH